MHGKQTRQPMMTGTSASARGCPAVAIHLSLRVPKRSASQTRGMRLKFLWQWRMPWKWHALSRVLLTLAPQHCRTAAPCQRLPVQWLWRRCRSPCLLLLPQFAPPHSVQTTPCGQREVRLLVRLLQGWLIVRPTAANRAALMLLPLPQGTQRCSKRMRKVKCVRPRQVQVAWATLRCC